MCRSSLSLVRWLWPHIYFTVVCQCILSWTICGAFLPHSSSRQPKNVRTTYSVGHRNLLAISLRATPSSLGDPQEGIRLNKIFKETHSRREADKLIASGRVAVNGVLVESKGGFKVVPFQDKVTLDGQLIRGWEEMNSIPSPSTSHTSIHAGGLENFEYVKYWKPRGVTCTTDRSIRGNLIDEIGHDGYRPSQRVYPVGRLDKDSSGLILLTSDGRLPNSALRSNRKQPKVYEVFVDGPGVREEHLQRLRDGIVITTVAQRDQKSKSLTAKTLPCKVERIGLYGLQITLVEGRNRQIRRMLDALGYRVRELHRVQFMGISLDPLQGPGEWEALGDKDMRVLANVLVP